MEQMVLGAGNSPAPLERPSALGRALPPFSPISCFLLFVFFRL